MMRVVWMDGGSAVSKGAARRVRRLLRGAKAIGARRPLMIGTPAARHRPQLIHASP